MCYVYRSTPKKGGRSGGGGRGERRKKEGKGKETGGRETPTHSHSKQTLIPAKYPVIEGMVVGEIVGIEVCFNMAALVVLIEYI